MENQQAPQKKKPNRMVVDIGTNSTRMLIFRLDKKGRFLRVNKSVRYTRMGQGVDQTKRLHEDAIKRNLEALEEFKSIGEDYGVVDYYIFGTSAMRDAENTQEFVDLVKEKLDLEVVVVSGDKEAEYGFFGVSQTFDDAVLIFDIGGGSTELIYGEGDELRNIFSLNLGCVRSTEKYIRNDPPTATEIAELKGAALSFLKDQAATILPQQPFTLVGIGGTATTISTIKQGLQIYDSERVHKSQVTLTELQDILRELEALSLEERSTIAGLEAKRADVIIAGGIILEAILEFTGRDAFTVCDYDNLEGAAYEVFLKPEEEKK